MKKENDKYVMVNKKQYKQLMNDVELLKGKINGINARLSQILTIFNKVDAQEVDTDTHSYSYINKTIPGTTVLNPEYNDALGIEY